MAFWLVLPVKLRLPLPLNWQGGPFLGRQKQHFSAHYRTQFKLIKIVKVMIFMMIMVIILMILVMKITKNKTNTIFKQTSFLKLSNWILCRWQWRRPSSQKCGWEVGQVELISLNRIRTFADVGCCDMFGGVRFVVWVSCTCYKLIEFC